jgi:hypothetical protein
MFTRLFGKTGYRQKLWLAPGIQKPSAGTCAAADLPGILNGALRNLAMTGSETEFCLFAYSSIENDVIPYERPSIIHSVSASGQLRLCTPGIMSNRVFLKKKLKKIKKTKNQGLVTPGPGFLDARLPLAKSHATIP